jgi:hypothetical protein
MLAAGACSNRQNCSRLHCAAHVAGPKSWQGAGSASRNTAWRLRHGTCWPVTKQPARYGPPHRGISLRRQYRRLIEVPDDAERQIFHTAGNLKLRWVFRNQGHSRAALTWCSFSRRHRTGDMRGKDETGAGGIRARLPFRWPGRETGKTIPVPYTATSS